MEILERRELPLALVILMVLVSMMDLFVYNPTIRMIASEFQTWAIIMSGFTLGLGAMNILFIHGTIVAKKIPGRWIPSGVFAISFVTMLATGLIDLNFQNPIFEFIYTYIYVPLYAAGYALTGFYLTTALYKAFRVRTYESALLIIAACIMLFKNAPIGEAILGKGIVSLGDWLMAVPNASGNIAILICFAIGVVILSLRVLLGLERGFLGGTE